MRALMKHGPGELSPEQSVAVKRLSMEWGWTPRGSAAARKSPDFVLACLRHPDPAARRVGKGAAEKALAVRIDFDWAAAESERDAAVRKIETLLRAASQ
jgi:hypothetical protein